MKKGGGEVIGSVKVKIYRNNYQLGKKINAIAENNMQRIQDLQMLQLAIVFACICGNIPYGKILPRQFCKLEAQWGVCKNTPLNTNGSDVVSTSNIHISICRVGTY
jgi:hypothetical protein